MEFERGPFAEREPFPFPPRVVRPGLFTALAQPLVDLLGDADAPLAALASEAGAGGLPDLDQAYASTIGVAEEVTAGQFPIDSDQTADVLAQTGEGSEMYRQSVLRYLPQPDAEIETGFDDPPRPPGLEAPEPTPTPEI